jgi:hypothetical protein
MGDCEGSSRPKADLGHRINMLQCGSSLRPFVQSAPFRWL